MAAGTGTASPYQSYLQQYHPLHYPGNTLDKSLREALYHRSTQQYVSHHMLLGRSSDDMTQLAEAVKRIAGEKLCSKGDSQQLS